MKIGYAVYGLAYAKDLSNKENQENKPSIAVASVQSDGTVGLGKRKTDQGIPEGKRQDTGKAR